MTTFPGWLESPQDLPCMEWGFGTLMNIEITRPTEKLLLCRWSTEIQRSKVDAKSITFFSILNLYYIQKYFVGN